MVTKKELLRKVEALESEVPALRGEIASLRCEISDLKASQAKEPSKAYQRNKGDDAQREMMRALMDFRPKHAFDPSKAGTEGR